LRNQDKPLGFGNPEIMLDKERSIRSDDWKELFPTAWWMEMSDMLWSSWHLRPSRQHSMRYTSEFEHCWDSYVFNNINPFIMYGQAQPHFAYFLDEQTDGGHGLNN
jgi:hypothetical protein